MKRIALLKDELFVNHDPGYGHLDSPERLTSLYSNLLSLGPDLPFVLPPCPRVSRETLLLNHSPSHLDRVAATAGKMYSVLEEDTFTSKLSYEAALTAAGALVKGVDLLVDRSVDSAFALVRPPGHHAEEDNPMGFCLFNNIAIGAHHCLAHHGMERILIVDWDVHHGNGTQNSFYTSDKVFYISIHQSPFYPGTGGLEETGKGEGEGYTQNIPLPGGQGDLEYANIMNTLIVPLARQYQPEIILVSAGFDSHLEDSISSMCLTYKGFAYMTTVLRDLAAELCGGKILFTLEGGYSVSGLNEGVFSVLSALLQQQLDTPFPSYLLPEQERSLQEERSVHPAIERVRDVAKNYWKM